MLKNIGVLLLLIVTTIQIGWAQTVGVIQHNSSAFNGYTLFAPVVSKNTYLIDNCGHLVNSWESEYRPNFSAYLLEDGSLLRLVKIPAPTQDGFAKGGIEIHNWEGELIWQYSFVNSNLAQHHDIAPLPNGNILVITIEEIPLENAIENGRDASETPATIWAEKIVEIKPVGNDDMEIVWEWRAWDHLIQDYDASKANYGIIADHPERINVNYGSLDIADWMHFNAIDYNASLDQIALSSRNFDEIYIIDHSTSTEEAASSAGGNAEKGGDILYRFGNPETYDRGTEENHVLFGQHNVHWIEEGFVDGGKLMVFNNGVSRPEGNYSTIDIFEPPVDVDGNYILNGDEPFGPDELSWTYESLDSPFYSSKISGAQRLPNGNTMICIGNSSEIIEVTYSGDIVWEYKIPISATGPLTQGDVIGSSSIFRSLRYGPDYPAFDNVNLVAGDVLELDPGPTDCQLYVLDNTETFSSDEFTIAPNPVSDLLRILNPNGTSELIKIYSIAGQEVFSIQSAEDEVMIDMVDWSPGCYFLQIFDLDGKLLQASKLVTVN